MPLCARRQRVVSVVSGASCHSSSSRGSGPASSPAGSTWAASRALGLDPNITSLRACRRSVDVLPQARGPSSTTAGNAPSPACTWGSTTLGEYQSNPLSGRPVLRLTSRDGIPVLSDCI